MSYSIPIDEIELWPETLMIRDTKIYDDLGGLGQRIYTTAGAGYKKVKYVRIDKYDELKAKVELAALELKGWRYS